MLRHYSSHRLRVVFPEAFTLAEKKRSMAEVALCVSVAGWMEAVVSANLQRATRLHQSILHKAFSGELQP